MSREENLKILQLLQEGKITADEASKLLAAIDAPAAEPEAKPVPPPPPTPPIEDAFETETLSRARAKIAAAREKVAGMDQQLAAAEEKIEEAKKSSDPIGSLNEALRGLPGAKSIAGAFRDFDPGRFASNAKKQARKLGKQVSDSIGNIDIDLSTLTHGLQGEPTTTQNYELTFELEPGKTLRVKNPLGGIAVQGADVPGARVAGELKVWAASSEEALAIAEQVQVAYEPNDNGGAVTVTSGGKARRIELDLKVFVPHEGIKVSLLSPAGDLSVRGLKAAVVLATQSGDIHVAEIAGDVATETTSGDIAIEGVLGSISAHTASGDITAIRLDGPSFKAESQSGDVSLSEAMVPQVTLSTVSGDSTLRSVTGEALNIRTVSGDAHVDSAPFTSEMLVDTVSGGIHAVLKNALTTGKVVLASVSGDTHLALPPRTNAVLEGRTRSGELRGKIKGPDGQAKSISGNGMVIVSEIIGDGTGAAIVLSSVSGDVRVEQEL